MIQIAAAELVLSVIWACSSRASLSSNVVIASYHAAIGGGIVAALLFDRLVHHQKGWAFPIAYCLMLIHPAWTISAITGDCGKWKRDASYWVTGILTALLIWQFARVQLQSRRDANTHKSTRQANFPPLE